MACEQVWTADTPGLVASLKSTAANLRLNVSIRRMDYTARGVWVYVEICGSTQDVMKMIEAMT